MKLDAYPVHHDETNVSHLKLDLAQENAAQKIYVLLNRFVQYKVLTPDSGIRPAGFKVVVSLQQRSKSMTNMVTFASLRGTEINEVALSELLELFQKFGDTLKKVFDVEITPHPAHFEGLRLKVDLQQKMDNLPDWMTIVSHGPEWDFGVTSPNHEQKRVKREMRGRVAGIYGEKPERQDPSHDIVDRAFPVPDISAENIDFASMQMDERDFCFPRIEFNFKRNNILTRAQLVQALGTNTMNQREWQIFIRDLNKNAGWEINRINQGARLALEIWLEKNGLLTIT